MENVITIDMGGTSFDVSMVTGGLPMLTRELRVHEMPVGVAAVNVHSIGAGGGSIAWIDKGGALQVGPQSAGAEPGPACYGQGGRAPTCTDANVVLVTSIRTTSSAGGVRSSPSCPRAPSKITLPSRSPSALPTRRTAFPHHQSQHGECDPGCVDRAGHRS